MPDDTCGAECADGTPCEHPTTDDGDPDRCWIDAHNESPVAAGQPGRDYAIDPADHDAILDAARSGMSKAGCARAAGATKDSLRRYLDAHPEFRADFMRARAEGERKLATLGLSDPDTDAQMARFLLSTSYEYVKTERREVEGEVEGEMNVTIDFSDVDT